MMRLPARARWSRTVLAAVALHAAGACVALAQSAQKPTLSVAATITAQPSSQVGLAIRVGPPEAVPANSFVRLRGLPAMAALSEGHAIAPGAWAVSLAALPNLRITLPAGASGRSEISITLVAVDGAVLAEQKSVLNVAAAAPPQPPAGAPPTANILSAGVEAGPPATSPDGGARAPAPPAPAAPAMKPEDRDRALRLMKKGQEQLGEANISAARLFYERAADAGLAEAAMALAATYDAAELPRLNIRGVQPDAKEAKRWYERARQLGAGEADQRLRRLGAN